ncbi:hypothetical protein BKA93DRAFT_829141 [Sparassis latifolia]|uniref:Ketoreductase domain-containing protein n=1 Tax=Sparassis crispa TaxID=139825 RepID=A0A401GPV3_9APHY|nr:hypothetical protein SCP_0602240 [Sparassis crispa]GBE84246.1 hypothetical protein SCP_0602240 [Sparassis crispa]
MTPKVWVITGANSGIGLALAQHVLSQGDRVIATVRSKAKVTDSLKGAESLVLDLNGPDSEIRKAGEAALKIYGHVDVLVNNAGFGVIGPVEELDIDDVRKQFQTNVFGAIAFTQAFLPHFRERRSGHILNVTSVGAFCNRPHWGAYAASKAAFDAFSESLSYEVEPYNVRVLVIMPGYFSTRFFGASPSVGKLSTVYTAPEQGYNSLEVTPKKHVESKQIGDPEKLAQRVYEVVHETGMAKGLMESQGGKRGWMRVLLGPDGGERIFAKLDAVKENVEVFEKIWRSTDVEPERLKFYPDG